MLILLKFLKPHRIPVSLVLILLFVQSLSELYLPTLMADIVDIGIVNGDIDYILRIGGIMLLVALGGTFAIITANFLSSKIATGFGKAIRSEVFSQVESYSLHEFDKIGTASLITRTTNDITQVQQVMIMFLRMFVRAPMMIIGGIIMAVSKDAQLSLTIIFAIPVISFIITIVINKSIPLFKVMQYKLDNINRVLREGLTGIRVIRAFNTLDYEKRRFDKANQDLIDTTIEVNKIMAVLMPLMMLLLNLTIVAVIWFGSIRINSNSMQVGDLMAFIQYVMMIMFPLILFSRILVMIPRASASASRINEILNISPEIKDPVSAQDTLKLKGVVEFRNVAFKYPGAEEPAVTNISFKTVPGKITAIIGGTGSGKSTLMNLILRFYDVDNGSILVDGLDIRNMTQKNLRNKIGYVPQNSVLFSGTIADNVRYGNINASDDEVYYAADIAQATGFILKMKEGFNSFISQGGRNISGGQKQRLSIARALVRKAEIYIFDDSFSALDFKTDARLRASLKKETVDSTVLIVAQRVSTIMYADQIVVLDSGKIAGIGKHKNLLKSCEVYREIVSSQLAEEETA